MNALVHAQEQQDRHSDGMLRPPLDEAAELFRSRSRRDSAAELSVSQDEEEEARAGVGARPTPAADRPLQLLPRTDLFGRVRGRDSAVW